MKEPPFTLGIEEEYLVVDAGTMELAPVPDRMLKAAEAKLKNQVSPEFRDCMIEVGTRVSATVAEAREDLAGLRATLSAIADDHGLRVVAVSCHPFGRPEEQSTGPRQRYLDIAHDTGLDMVAELVELFAPDAAALSCGAELRRTLDIVAEGGSATRQRRLVAEAVAEGADETEAFRHLLRHLERQFRARA